MTRTKTDHLVVLEEWRECHNWGAHTIYKATPELLRSSYYEEKVRIVYDPETDNIELQIFSEDKWQSVYGEFVKLQRIPLFTSVFQDYLDRHAI